MSGRRQEYKPDRNRSSGFRLRSQGGDIHSGDFKRQDTPFGLRNFLEVRTSDWLLCFSDLSVFNHYLTPGFFYGVNEKKFSQLPMVSKIMNSCFLELNYFTKPTQLLNCILNLILIAAYTHSCQPSSGGFSLDEREQKESITENNNWL